MADRRPSWHGLEVIRICDAPRHEPGEGSLRRALSDRTPLQPNVRGARRPWAGLLAQSPAPGSRPSERAALLDAGRRPRPPGQTLPGRRPGRDAVGSKRTGERADHAAKGAPTRGAPGAG